MNKLFPILILITAIACKKNQSEQSSFDESYARAKIVTAWNETMPNILKQVISPSFKDTTYSISDTLSFRSTLNKVIEQISVNGGGTIKVAPGNYFVKGSIFMKSNVNLHISEGAILNFSPNPSDYLPMVKMRWEGTFIMNYSPLIYAIDQENIAITGKGKIDGNCEEVWASWKKKQRPGKMRARQMGNDQIPIEERVFGEGYFLRPPGIQFIKCKNILLEDFTIKSTPFWTINPILSENITVRRLSIQKGTTNDDGIDPESCKNVLIENCTINTHDDCIAIKAGRDQDGWKYPPSENIVIRNNDFTNIVGSGFCIGSEMSAGVRNVFAENNTLRGSDKHAFQFKSNPDRGGFIEEIYMRNMKVLNPVKYGFEFTTDYKGWRGNAYFVKYNNFYFQNITLEEASAISIKINGRSEENIQKVFMENITVKRSPAPVIANFTQDLLLKNISVNGKMISDKDITTTTEKK
ncbi:glycoside hydrolase family 28 protein [Aquimarina gracilis]|uniref:Glycoside hydrolase family 28 protein n=1 Tax=Aquimarina gracilis TaxID=874422 RepID=A0ABU5ZSL9_9FLAO|nr:glycoside hydrolase family 28 protein [Aquimarina gracilis]MEB3344377.1 glycoside hydrolase family 28 protein [Aquimarina gracilis]